MPLLIGGMIITAKLAVSLDAANLMSDLEVTVSGEK